MCTMGKALSGGFYPISAVVGSSKVMKDFMEYDEGCIYSSCPLACKIMMESVRVMKDDGLLENCVQ